MNSFLQIRGREIVSGTTPIRFCGVNAGNWMLVESYMLGLPWTEQKMRQAFLQHLGRKAYDAFWDTYMDTSLSDDDFAFMKKLGFNLIQCPFNWHHFSSHPASQSFGNRGLEYLTRFVSLCKRHNMYALLGLHAAPGCQARDWNAESAWGETQHWDYTHWRDETNRIWREITRQFADEPAVFGYELPNEPVADDLDAFHRQNMAQIRTIRRYDSNHIIVVNSNRWGKEIASLRDELFLDPNVMPSLNHYHLHFQPFSSLKRFPGRYKGKKYGESELFATLDKARDFSRIVRPHLVGECGTFAGNNPLAHSSAHLRMWDSLLGHFNDSGMGWNFWALKDIGMMGLLYPRRDTAWQQFLHSARVRNIRNSFQRGQDDIRGAIARHARFAVDDDIELLLYGLQHHWDAATLPKVLTELKRYGIGDLRAMAQSFRFRSCDTDKDKYDIVKRRAAQVTAINKQFANRDCARKYVAAEPAHMKR